MRCLLVSIFFFALLGYAAADECQWITSDWSACNNGVRTRTVYCSHIINGVSADYLCEAAIGPKPASIESCYSPPAVQPVAYTWVVSAFSECSQSCGGGVKTREVYCYDSNGSPSAFVNCNPTIQPSNSEVCNQHACQPAGQVIGDPQFTGLRGQQYQVHGVANQIYAIISDPALQLNARFVFLDSGSCPIVNGIRRTNGCFSHPGSYLGEIGLLLSNGDRIRFLAGSGRTGYDAIEYNGRLLSVGDRMELTNGGGFTYLDTHTFTLSYDRYTFTFENSDMFLNQQVRVNDFTNIQAHGLLGQTHTKKPIYNAKRLPIEGEIEEYVLNDLFGSDFNYNQFKKL